MYFNHQTLRVEQFKLQLLILDNYIIMRIRTIFAVDQEGFLSAHGQIQVWELWGGWAQAV
ncbi:hypothetical protein COX69_00405 [Candidatus Falkowbacteria bacterium CG_4_10_14_0_2_um_filter_48_10]|nr:MAG: hypothetical protein COX69_00405 [Candidatus Falkowbacteria bacterium CG_4_10_14_0_2_um_filter_48_10]